VLLEDLSKLDFQRGKVGTLGVQAVESDYKNILRLCSMTGHKVKKLDDNNIKLDPLTFWEKGISQETLFKLLNFKSIESFDFFQHEKPTHIINLNQPIDDHFKEKYSLVFDSGTLEHLFDIKTAMTNIVNMTEIGGLYYSNTANEWSN
jgi:hypothetical protein